MADDAPDEQPEGDAPERRGERSPHPDAALAIDRLDRTPPSKHTLKFLVAPIIVLIICSNIASFSFATLQEQNPTLLIALSSSNRNLALVANKLDALTYYSVGTLRLLVSDPLFFLIGYWYGEKALRWVELRSKTYGPMLRQAEAVFAKAAIVLVAVAPNNYICLFAGAAGMRVSVFFAVNLVGTLVRLYSIRVLGNVFSSPLETVSDFLSEYQLQIFLIMTPITLWFLYRDFKGGEIDALRHLDDDLEPDGDAADGTGTGVASPSDGERPAGGVRRPRALPEPDDADGPLRGRGADPDRS